MNRKRRPFRRTALAVVLTAAALTASGCSESGETARIPTAPASTATPPPSLTTATPVPVETVAAPITVAVLGDSHTTGFSGTLEAGMAAGTAWVTQLPADEFSVVGGWAVDGSTASAMADAAESLPDASVLIVMAGTNDIAVGVPTDATLNEITRIAEVVGARSMLLCAIPPMNWAPSAAQDLNAALEAHANAQGWLFIDPWVPMRSGDGTWVAEYLTDGVHTSAEGYATAGRQIARHLSDVLR